jgi:hypothetical protein
METIAFGEFVEIFAETDDDDDNNNARERYIPTLPETMTALLDGNPEYIPSQTQLLEAFAHYEYYDPNITMPYLSSYLKVINLWSRARISAQKINKVVVMSE